MAASATPATHRNRRAAYDSPRFCRLWHSSMTLREIASEYGVSIAAINFAAMRRGFPKRLTVRKAAMEQIMTERETQFLVALNEAAEKANRPGGPGADYLGLCHSLGPAYGLLPSRAMEVVLDNITDIVGTG